MIILRGVCQDESPQNLQYKVFRNCVIIHNLLLSTFSSLLLASSFKSNFYCNLHLVYLPVLLSANRKCRCNVLTNERAREHQVEHPPKFKCEPLLLTLCGTGRETHSFKLNIFHIFQKFWCICDEVKHHGRCQRSRCSSPDLCGGGGSVPRRGLHENVFSLRSSSPAVQVWGGAPAGHLSQDSLRRLQL